MYRSRSCIASRAAAARAACKNYMSNDSSKPQPVEELTIHIFAAADGGYMYDIYAAAPDSEAVENGASDDGGLCTTTIENALDMARSQALDIINRRK